MQIVNYLCQLFVEEVMNFALSPGGKPIQYWDARVNDRAICR